MHVNVNVIIEPILLHI